MVDCGGCSYGVIGVLDYWSCEEVLVMCWELKVESEIENEGFAFDSFDLNFCLVVPFPDSELERNKQTRSLSSHHRSLV